MTSWMSTCSRQQKIGCLLSRERAFVPLRASLNISLEQCYGAICSRQKSGMQLKVSLTALAFSHTAVSTFDHHVLSWEPAGLPPTSAPSMAFLRSLALPPLRPLVSDTTFHFFLILSLLGNVVLSALLSLSVKGNCHPKLVICFAHSSKTGPVRVTLNQTLHPKLGDSFF